MQLGYNTNGFGFHRLGDALSIIAELGYSCVAITPDIHHCDPFQASAESLHALRNQLSDLGLTCVIEAGARYILDPRRKHRPTLLDDQPQLRMEFLKRCMELAHKLNALCVSTWSGARPTDGKAADLDDAQLFEVLASKWNNLTDEIGNGQIPLAMEPEPGFLVANCGDYDRLCELTGRRIPLTLDVGHCVCEGDIAPEAAIRRYSPDLVNLQLDDMRRGVHEHLCFGEGEVNFAAIFDALQEINYQGPACVELSSASRNAVVVAADSMRFLRRFISPA